MSMYWIIFIGFALLSWLVSSRLKNKFEKYSKIPMTNGMTGKDVAEKIESHDVLAESDYTTMIDYCGEYAKKAQKYFDIINSQADSLSAESVQATSDLAKLYGEYRYLDLFRDILDNTEERVLGKNNVRKVEELAKYEAFPLPEGAGVSFLDTNVIGDIEDMPADSGEVIAAGVGEAVNVP